MRALFILLIMLALAMPTGFSHAVTPPLSGICESAMLTNHRQELMLRFAESVRVWPLYSVKRYGALRGARIAGTLYSLGSKFMPLLVDAGLSLRVDEFARFVREQRIENLDPWEARNRFASSLGTITLYRGLTLEAGEEERILSEGMDSKYLSRWRRMQRFAQLDFSTLEQPLSVQLSERVAGFVKNDLVLSVTEYPEIAYYIATLNAKPGRDLVYVFQLQLSPLDALPHHEARSSIVAPYRFRIGSREIPSGDPGVEQFILMHIEPHEIVEARLVREGDLDPVGWEDSRSP